MSLETTLSITEGLKAISIKIIAERSECVPTYGSYGAAGADLRANISSEILIPAGQRTLISTGIRAEIPVGYEMQIRPRSGLALKHGISILNSPGTIDCDYRGDIGVILMNHSTTDFIVTPLMRIAQCVIAPYIKADFIVTEELSETTRGAGGFGHTGFH